MFGRLSNVSGSGAARIHSYQFSLKDLMSTVTIVAVGLVLVHYLALPFSGVIAAECGLDAAREGVQVGNRAMGEAAEPVHFQA